MAQLNRAERAQILSDCMSNEILMRMCIKRSALFPMSPVDLMDEIAVRMWIALWEYRRKPIDEAFKIALKCGYNQLRTLVRNQMKKITLVNDANKLEKTPDNSIIGLETKEVLDCMEKIAIMLVGKTKAVHLIRSVLLDWQPPLGARETVLLECLETSYGQFILLYHKYRRLVYYQTKIPAFLPLRKVYGKWK